MSRHPYSLLLYLYPKRFRHLFGSQMEQLFADVASANGKLYAWQKVIIELPKSLFIEHVDNIKIKYATQPQTRGLTAVLTGLGAFILLSGLQLKILETSFNIATKMRGSTATTQQIWSIIFGNEPLNGPTSRVAIYTYTLTGIIIGLITKKRELKYAIITTFILILINTSAELITIYYYTQVLHNTSYLSGWNMQFIFDIQSYLYLITFTTLGSLSGRAAKEYFAAKSQPHNMPNSYA